MHFTEDGTVPDMCRVRALMISMGLELAIVIFMLISIRWCWSKPNSNRRLVAARHDWHPVSAIAAVGREREVGKLGSA